MALVAVVFGFGGCGLIFQERVEDIVTEYNIAVVVNYNNRICEWDSENCALLSSCRRNNIRMRRAFYLYRCQGASRDYTLAFMGMY